MKDRIDIALVGIGGYGNTNFTGLTQYDHPDHFRITGIIDPFFQQAPARKTIEQMNIPVFSQLDEYYQQGREADLVIISSPIAEHCRQSCTALSHGSHVMCEKPLGGTVQEARQMIAARDAAQKWAAIGYQWSFTTPIQKIKADILAGVFGAPKRFKTIVLWPRDHRYFNRNSWAGARRNDKGQWILDSPVNNAVAHYLHNMLYLLGKQTDRSAELTQVQGELYRTNAIENFDTGILRTLTTDNVEVLFYATHACRDLCGPLGELEFENAVIRYQHPDDEFVAEFKDGSTINYGSPNKEYHHKLYVAINALRTGAPILCGLEAAAVQTLCVNGLHDSVPQIGSAPANLVRTTNIANPPENEPAPQITWIDGINQLLMDCYQKNALPHEVGVAWAQPGKIIDLQNYRDFPQSPQE